ncbi:MAG: alpha/beta fold hydrolase [Pseudobdellovibrionaceae bacterium]
MIFKLASGRNIFYEVFGDPEGIPCFFFHGFPGSHAQAKIAEKQALEHKIKIIAADRPGLGNSDFDSGRTLLSTVQDIEELANHLRHEKFYIIGVSGGAPYALASTYYFKDRVYGLGLVCPLGPLNEKDFRNTFSTVVKSLFFLVHKYPRLMKMVYRKIIAKFDKNPDKFLLKMSQRLSPRDRAIMQNPAILAILRNSFRHSYKQDPGNVLNDMQIYNSDWGFSLSEISNPTTIWHGTSDTIVPYQHSVLINKAIPHSQFFTFKDEGHYSVAIEQLPLIMKELKAIKL